MGVKRSQRPTSWDSPYHNPAHTHSLQHVYSTTPQHVSAHKNLTRGRHSLYSFLYYLIHSISIADGWATCSSSREKGDLCLVSSFAPVKFYSAAIFVFSWASTLFHSSRIATDLFNFFWFSPTIDRLHLFPSSCSYSYLLQHLVFLLCFTSCLCLNSFFQLCILVSFLCTVTCSYLSFYFHFWLVYF